MSKHNLSDKMRYALRCYWKPIKHKGEKVVYICFVGHSTPVPAWNTMRALQHRGLVEYRTSRLTPEGVRMHLKFVEQYDRLRRIPAREATV